MVETYDRVVEVQRTTTENVRIKTTRRYCRDCKKLVSKTAPGVAPNARISANKSAAMMQLNMAGLSHGKVADFCIETGGVKTTRSRTYRNKMSVAKRLAPRRDAIRRDVLKEPYLICDEFWCPLGKKSGTSCRLWGQRAA